MERISNWQNRGVGLWCKCILIKCHRALPLRFVVGINTDDRCAAFITLHGRCWFHWLAGISQCQCFFVNFFYISARAIQTRGLAKSKHFSYKLFVSSSHRFHGLQIFPSVLKKKFRGSFPNRLKRKVSEFGWHNLRNNNFIIAFKNCRGKKNTVYIVLKFNIKLYHKPKPKLWMM